MPKLITSIPCACFSEILRSSSAKRYGGRRSSRSLVFTKCLQEFVGERPGVHRDRPSDQVDVQVLPHLDFQLAAVELNRHRAVYPAYDGGDCGANGAGARRHRLADATFEDPSA